MKNIQLGIPPLSFEDLCTPEVLHEKIYPDLYKNYYWSDDFSPEYYIAQAKAGFIAVTDYYEGEQLLLPEIQFSYALLSPDALHISRKVRKLLRDRQLSIEVGRALDEVAREINASYKSCWLTEKYLETLKNTQDLDKNFQVIAVTLKEDGKLIAGEIGYILGKSYTSLSGFSSKEKRYRNYGTAQLVLLGQYLQENDCVLWNLGQTYMEYKLALGAKAYERTDFLKQWFPAIQSPATLPVS